MEGFEIRLTEERKSLTIKIINLKAFLGSDTANTLKPSKILVMENQLEFMEKYESCLIERITTP